MDEPLEHIATFKRPVSRDEIDCEQGVLDKLVHDGLLQTQAFDSVIIYWIPPSNTQVKEKELEADIIRLKARVSELNDKLDPYSNVTREMKPKMDTINKLHDYNDIKDAAQVLLGKLAEMEGVMTVELYEKYGLSKEDSA